MRGEKWFKADKCSRSSSTVYLVLFVGKKPEREFKKSQSSIDLRMLAFAIFAEFDLHSGLRGFGRHVPDLELIDMPGIITNPNERGDEKLQAPRCRWNSMFCESGKQQLEMKSNILRHKIEMPNGFSAAKVMLELSKQDAKSTKIRCHSSIKYQQLGMEVLTFSDSLRHTNHIVSVTVSQDITSSDLLLSEALDERAKGLKLQNNSICYYTWFAIMVMGCRGCGPFVSICIHLSNSRPGTCSMRPGSNLAPGTGGLAHPSKVPFAVAIHPSWPWWSALSASKRLVTLPFWMKWPRSPDSAISLPGRADESCESQVSPRRPFFCHSVLFGCLRVQRSRNLESISEWTDTTCWPKPFVMRVWVLHCPSFEERQLHAAIALLSRPDWRSHVLVVANRLKSTDTALGFRGCKRLFLQRQGKQHRHTKASFLWPLDHQTWKSILIRAPMRTRSITMRFYRRVRSSGLKIWSVTCPIKVRASIGKSKTIVCSVLPPLRQSLWRCGEKVLCPNYRCFPTRCRLSARDQNNEVRNYRRSCAWWTSSFFDKKWPSSWPILSTNIRPW